MQVKLHVALKRPKQPPQEFDLTLDKTSISVGRDRENDVQLPLSTVSRRHARIFWEGDNWFIADLHSTHGVLCNDQPLGSGGKRLLRDGDHIEIADATLIFNLIGDESLTAKSEEEAAALARQMVQSALVGESDSEGPYFIVLIGPHENQRLPINPNVGESVIGRGEIADIRLDDASVSRRHAIIRNEWNEVIIEDLGSKNGVVLNGTRIVVPTLLHDADEIQIGAVHLAFVDPSAAVIGPFEEKAPANDQLKTAIQEEPLAPIPAEGAGALEVPPTDSAIASVTVPTNTVQAAPNVGTTKGMGAAEYFLAVLAGVVIVGFVIAIVIALL